MTPGRADIVSLGLNVTAFGQVAEVDSASWDHLTRGEDVDYSRGYLRFLEQAEPGSSRLLACHDDTGALCGAAMGAVAVESTHLFSHATRLLTSSLILREGSAVAGPLEEGVRGALANHGGGSTRAEAGRRLESVIGPVFVIRSARDSRVVVDPALPADRERAVIRAVLEGAKEHAAESGCGAVALPYVPANAAAHVEALEEAGFDGALTCASTSFDLEGCAGRDEFAARLSKGKRRTFRQEIAAFQESGLELREIPLADFVDRVTELEAATAERHGDVPHRDALRGRIAALAEYTEPFIRTVACCLGDRIVASAIDFEGRASYFCLTYGADYSVMPRGCAYQMMTFYHPIERACARGIPSVYLGIDVYEPKLRRGAELFPLRTYVWTRDPAARELAGKWLDLVDRRNRAFFDELRGR